MSCMNSKESSPYSVFSHVRKFLMVWLFWFPNPAIFIAAAIALTSACRTSSHVGKCALSFAYPLSRLTSVVFCDRIVKMRHSSTSPAPSRDGTPSKSSNVSEMSAAFCLSSNCVLPNCWVFNIIPPHLKNNNVKRGSGTSVDRAGQRGGSRRIRSRIRRGRCREKMGRLFDAIGCRRILGRSI